MSDKKITPVTHNESVLEFDPNAGLHRVYDWKPYTIHRTPCPRNQGAVTFLKAVQALPDHCKTGR